MAHTASDPRFAAIIDPSAEVRQLGTGFVFTEGPLWHPAEQYLLFSDMPGDVRRRWSASGGIEVEAQPSNKGNGLTYDAALNLLVCEHATSAVARISPDGKREVLATHFEGRELNSPNDICVAADGSIYFTDPVFGRMEHFGVPRPLEMGFQGVYRLAPDHRPGDEAQLVCDRSLFGQPNGLCFTPGERLLYVNDTEQANIRAFEIAADGSLANGRVFAEGIAEDDRGGRPDGMKVDADGNVYVTGPGGIWVYNPAGAKLGEIAFPEGVANMHWGGEGWRTLFVTATTSLYAVDLKVRGRAEPFMGAA